VFFKYQAEPWLGSNFASFDEPSHKPARLGSIPPLVQQKAVGETKIEDVCASVRAFIRPARVAV
jgi:hypothetical protein